MKNKVNIISIMLIVVSFVIITFSIGLKIYKSSPSTIFKEEVKFVYNYLNDLYKEDKEKEVEKRGRYYSVSLFNNGHRVTYVGIFDVENDIINYLCVANGTKRTEFKNKVDLNNIIIEQTDKTCVLSEE